MSHRNIRFAYVIALFVLILSAWGYLSMSQKYVPVPVTQRDLHDMTTIVAPETTQVFFGTLTGFPHTYEITAYDPFMLTMGLRVPSESDVFTPLISSIVIKVPRKGRVEEITRLLGEEDTWVTFEDEMVGETYQGGTMFTKALGPGTYHIEVHTPNNIEPYMLRVGMESKMHLGYGALLGRLISLEYFYGNSALGIITSRYVYVPIFVLMLSIVILFHGIKKGVFTIREDTQNK